jgi:catechol 2,3-dioxygenase-like lactoylglutathione lyase family enzyme
MLAGAPFIGFVPTTDLAGARSFYEGRLGLRCSEENPVACVFDAGGTMLRVTAVPELTPAGFTVGGWRVDDIGAVVKALASAGVAFRRFDGMDQDELGVWTTPSGDKVAWFTDPDGNVLSVTEFAN